MAITAPNNPTGDSKSASTPTEKPDPAAAEQGGGGEDRPGFDLGGAADRTGGSEGSPPGSPVRPGGSMDPAPASSESANSRPKPA